MFDEPIVFVVAVARGEPIRHTFTFRNSGTAQLVVDLQTGCACLATLTTFSRVAPGERSGVTVDIDTHGLPEGHEAPIGVLVQTNDPTRPKFTINIIAHVSSEVLASERTLEFGTVPAGQAVTREVEVVIVPGSNVTVLCVRSTDGALNASAKPIAGKKGRGYLVTVTRKRAAPQGPHFGNIVIHTSSRWTPELRIPTQGNVGPKQSMP